MFASRIRAFDVGKQLNGQRVHVRVRLPAGQKFAQIFSVLSPRSKAADPLEEAQLIGATGDIHVEPLTVPLGDPPNAGDDAKSLQKRSHVVRQVPAGRRQVDSAFLFQVNAAICRPEVLEQMANFRLAEAEYRLGQAFVRGALVEQTKIPQPLVDPFVVPAIAIAAEHQLVPVPFTLVAIHLNAKALLCNPAHQRAVLF